MLAVACEVIQISALECSMDTTALPRRPLRIPTWTSTSVTENATPQIVTMNLMRS